MMLRLTRPMKLRLTLAILAFAFGLVSADDPRIRLVTWNVADNSKMAGGFDDAAIDRVLGLGEGQLSDLYAIGLQEQCWQCNEQDMMDIPNKFLRRLNQHGQFVVVGIEGTRESMWCEWGCLIGTHGSTFVLVLAREALVKEANGVAYMRLSLSSGLSVCVAASHLESRDSKVRRQCLDNFFGDANENLQWSNCDYQFLGGDFNTRTGSNSGDSWFLTASDSQPMLDKMKDQDEMTGSNPYGRSEDWNGNMLAFINTVQTSTYKEMSLKFVPTYKINEADENCQGNMPCYRTDRPQSWTDRILYTNGTGVKYEAILIEVSDHYPVAAEFILN